MVVYQIEKRTFASGGHTYMLQEQVVIGGDWADLRGFPEHKLKDMRQWVAEHTVVKTEVIE